MGEVTRRGFVKGAVAGAAALSAMGLLGGCTANKKDTTDAGSEEKDSFEGMEVLSYEADAVVVGAGTAGLQAAYKLAKEGLDVLVMEKAGSAAGSTFAMVSGPMAVETSVLRDAGVTVATKRNVFDHLSRFAKGSANTKLLSNLVENTTEAVESMVEVGLTFYTYMEWTGDSRYAEDITWAPVHNITQEGVDRVTPFVEAIEKQGATFLYSCEGKELILEEGKVVGIRGVQDGKLIEANAPAVFLSTGGFGADQEMIKDHFCGVTLTHMGAPTNTGDGIKMAQSAGAVLDRHFGLIANEICGANEKHGSAMYDAEWNLSNENLAFLIYGGLIVDQEGDRFMNEDALAFEPLVYSGQSALSANKMYAVVDAAYYEGCTTEGVYSYMGSPEGWNQGRELFYPVLSNAPGQLESAIEEGWAYKADTLKEVADYFELQNLEETIARYNTICQESDDADFSKDNIFLTPIGEGPFYVFEYNGSYWATLGGIRTDGNLRAMTAESEPIPGLYMGGLNMGSAFCEYYYDIKGAANGLSAASGVYGAKEIMKYLLEE